MAYTGINRLGPENIRAHHREVGSISPTCHHHKWKEIDALAGRVQSFVQGDRFQSLMSKKLAEAGITGADKDDFFADKKVTVHMTGATLKVDIEGIAGKAEALSLTLLAEEGLCIHTDTSAIRERVTTRTNYQLGSTDILTNDQTIRLPYLLPFMESVDEIFGPGRDLRASFGPEATPQAQEARLKETALRAATFGSQTPDNPATLQKEIAAVRRELDIEKEAKAQAESKIQDALSTIRAQDQKITTLSEELKATKARADQAQTNLEEAENQFGALSAKLEKRADATIRTIEVLQGDLKNAQMTAEATMDTLVAKERSLTKAKYANDTLRLKLAEKETALAAATSELKEHREQSADIIKANGQLKLSAIEAQNQIASLKKACASASDVTEKTSLEVTSLTKEVNALRQQVRDLQSKALDSESLTSKLESVESDLLSKEELLAGALKRAEAAESVSAQLKSTLDAETGGYDEIIAQLKKQLKEAQDEREQLRWDYESEEARATTLESTVRELRAHLAQLQSSPKVDLVAVETAAKNATDNQDQEALLLKIAGLEEELQTAESDLTQAKASRQALSEKLQTKNLQIASLEHDNSSLLEQVGKLSDAISSLKKAHTAEINALKDRTYEEAEGYLQEAEEATLKALQAEGKLSETEAKLKKALAQIDEIAIEKDLALTLSESQQSTIQDLESSLAELSGKRFITPDEAYALFQLRSSYESMHQELKEAQSARDKALLNERAARKELSSLSEKFTAAEALTLAQEERISSLKLAEKNLHKAQKGLESLSKEKDLRIKQLEAEADHLRMHAADCQDQAERALAAKLEAEHKLDATEGKASELEVHLGKLQQILDETPLNAKAQIESLKGQISTLKEEKKSLKTHISDLHTVIKDQQAYADKFEAQLNGAKEQIEAQKATALATQEAFQKEVKRISMKAQKADSAKQTIIRELQDELQEQYAESSSELEKAYEIISQKDLIVKEQSAQVKQLQAALDGQLEQMLDEKSLKELSLQEQLLLLQSKFEAAMTKHELEVQDLVQKQQELKRAHSEERAQVQNDVIAKLVRAIPTEVANQLLPQISPQNSATGQPVKA